MTPIEILMQEHRVIEQVLSCLEAAIHQAGEAGRLDPEAAGEITDFLRQYADRCHHGKEEDKLFPMLEENGMPAQGGPTGVMRMEHDQGRALVARMVAATGQAAAGEAAALQEFCDAGRHFVTLLRGHIDKEDHCLFPMAQQALGHQGMEELSRAFAQVEADMGAALSEQFVPLAARLARRYGIETRASDQASARGCLPAGID